MNTLVLDGVKIQKVASIKLTKNNTFYEKAGEFSNEIRIPLGIPESRKIFGNIDRIDVKKNPKTFEAELLVGPRCLIRGVATITRINDEEVTVQLLGGESAYNFWMNQKERYIDQLDMGTWFEFIWPDRSYIAMDRQGGNRHWDSYPPGDPHMRSIDQILTRLKYGDSGSDMTAGNWVEKLYNPMTPINMLPYYNREAERCQNVYGWIERQGQQPTFDLIKHDIDYGKNKEEGQFVPSLCLQPYLWAMTEAMAKACGYELDKEDNELYVNSLFRKIICMSGHANTAVINQAFPHWTIEEWWTNVERAFNLVMTIDYSSKKMKLRSRRSYYDGDRRFVIKDVEDAFTVDISDTPVEDEVTTQNIEFDEELGVASRLTDYIKDEARIIDTYENLEDLVEHEAGNTSKETLYRCKDGRTYIRVEKSIAWPWNKSKVSGFIEVDTHRDRIVSEDEDRISLKFIPCEWELFGHKPKSRCMKFGGKC